MRHALALALFAVMIIATPFALLAGSGAAALAPGLLGDLLSDGDPLAARLGGAAEPTTGYGRYEVVLRPAPGGVMAFDVRASALWGAPRDGVGLALITPETGALRMSVRAHGRVFEHTVELDIDTTGIGLLYVIEWRPDSVRWFVEDVLILEVGAHATPLPSAPGRMYTEGADGAGRVSCLAFIPFAASGALVDRAASCAGAAVGRR